MKIEKTNGEWINILNKMNNLDSGGLFLEGSHKVIDGELIVDMELSDITERGV